MIVFKNIDILDENFELKQNVSVRVEESFIKEISIEPLEPKEGERVIEGNNRVLSDAIYNGIKDNRIDPSITNITKVSVTNDLGICYVNVWYICY